MSARPCSRHTLQTRGCSPCLTLLSLFPACNRKFERFFEHFHEYDNIVVATFPTCHDPTLRELLRLGLPQRYIALVRPGAAEVGHILESQQKPCALAQCAQGQSTGGYLPAPATPSPHEQVHNPEYLNDTAISSMVRDHDIRLLAISPHVGNDARQVLEEQGVQVRWWGRCHSMLLHAVACMRVVSVLSASHGDQQFSCKQAAGLLQISVHGMCTYMIHTRWAPSYCRLSWTG